MRALNAIAATERRFEPVYGARVTRAAAPPATGPADLAQLVGELGDELVRHYADRRLRVDRTSPPPSTEVRLVATMPSRARGGSPGTTLRAVTTVIVKR